MLSVMPISVCWLERVSRGHSTQPNWAGLPPIKDLSLPMVPESGRLRDCLERHQYAPVLCLWSFIAHLWCPWRQPSHHTCCPFLCPSLRHPLPLLATCTFGCPAGTMDCRGSSTSVAQGHDTWHSDATASSAAWPGQRHSSKMVYEPA